MRARPSSRPPTSAERTKPATLLLVAGLVAVALVLNLRWVLPGPAFSRADLRTGAQSILFLTVSALEEHREATGTYPATLEAVGLDDEDLAYRLTSDGFEIRAVVGPDTLRYVAGDSLEPLADALDAAARGRAR